MIKHAVAKPIDPTATLGTSNGGMGIAIVMNRPHGKETCQTLAHYHRGHVPSQCVEMRNHQGRNDHGDDSQKLYDDPTALEARR
jgi:hypothetical protein